MESNHRPQHECAGTHRFQKCLVIRSFVGLDGIEPSASALSVQAMVLVTQVVYFLTCPFVPRRATQREVVPLRLGTFWARGPCAVFVGTWGS